MVSMEAWPTSTSMEQGRLLTYVQPAAVSIRPRSAQARVLGLGASAPRPADMSSRTTQGARRNGPREDRARSRRSWGGRGALTHWDGGGTTIHAMDIEGARRRSHEPTAVRTDLGLGWPESTHRWTGTTCRAASLDCSEWSEERDAGRARLDRVEGGDSRRTGPRAGRRSKMYR